MAFDETYFSSGNYSGLKAGPTGKYFWSRRFYANLVLRERRGGRLLEVGCGLGHLLKRFQDYFETYGADISPYSVEQSSKTAPRAKVSELPAEGIDTLGPEFFDVVVSIHVIEHLEDPEDFVRKVEQVLRPGGLFFMVTPNLGAPLRGWKGRSWQGFRDETHISLKYPDEWLSILRRNGFEIKRSFGDGMWDIPYVKSVPSVLQWPVFALPAALQVLASRPLIPVRFSESLVCMAVKS